MRARLLLIVALVFAPAACAGCVRAASEEAARGATPAVIDSTLGTLEDPRTRQRLAHVLATPEIRSAVRELSSDFSQGVVDELAREMAAPGIDHLLADRFSGALAEALSNQGSVGSGVDGLLRRSVDGMIDEASTAGNRTKVQAVASALTSSVVRTAGRELPASIVPAVHEALSDLGPAMREAMQNDVAPALRDALQTPALRAAVGETVRDLAKQAVFGSNEALAELSKEQQRENQSGGPLGAFFGRRIWLIVLVGGLLVLSIPLLLLRREHVAARRFREETRRRNTRVAALISLMGGARDEASWSRFLEMLRELLADATDKSDRPDKAARVPPPHPPEPRPA